MEREYKPGTRCRFGNGHMWVHRHDEPGVYDCSRCGVVDRAEQRLDARQVEKDTLLNEVIKVIETGWLPDGDSVGWTVVGTYLTAGEADAVASRIGGARTGRNPAARDRSNDA